MAKILRPYQQAAVDSVFDYFINGGTGSPLIVAPVGSGKTVIIAEIIKRIMQDAPRTRIVVLTSTQELLKQNGNELAEHIQDVDYGYYCAALNEKRLHNDITLASIQSVADKNAQFNRPPQIIIVDEAHTISHNEDTQYRKFIASCKAVNPDCVVIGLTGTPFRMDTGRIDNGDNALFDEIVYEIDIAWMIEQGFLCKPITPALNTHMRVDGVKIIKGDYAQGALEKAVDVDELTVACVDEIISNSAGRKKWLVFTAGVSHCEHVRDELRRRGIVAEMILGHTDKDERRDIMDKFKDGLIDCMVNVATMTTGVNVPDIDLIAFMRPTRSAVLYIQMIGRGLRIVKGKENLLLLDFGNVVAELGPIDAVNIIKTHREKRKGEEKAEPVTKRCPACNAICMGGQRYCFECSYEFSFGSALETNAGNQAILSSQELPKTLDVYHMQTSRHEKAGKTPSLKVTYTTIDGSFNEWICFEHEEGSFPQRNAIKWHFDRLQVPAPDNVPDALLLDYPAPSAIKVKRDGKFWKIIDHYFDHVQSDNLTDAETDQFMRNLKEIDIWEDDIPF